MLTCEHCRDEMAEYALGQCDPKTTAAMDAHLTTCVVCRSELAEIESAWAALPLVCEPATPRPEVFDRVVAQIDQISGRRLPASALARPEPILTARQRILSYILAASVLLALVGGALFRRSGPSSSGLGDLVADQALHDLAQRLGKLQELEQMLNRGSVRLASLYPGRSHKQVGAFVVWDLPAGQWHFYAPALPPAPAGKVYQLWAVAKGDDPLAGPTFVVDAAGMGSVVADFPQLKPGTEAKAMVTLEPEGGSQRPSGKPVLEAQL